jgi:flagellar hook-length control protein FliK
MTIASTSMQSALVLTQMPAESSGAGQMNFQLTSADGEQISVSGKEFFSMLNQNLIQVVSDADGQVIDNQKLMSMLGEADGELSVQPDELMPAQWMQFLKSHFSTLTDANSDMDSEQLVQADGEDPDEKDAILQLAEQSTDQREGNALAIPMVIPVTRQAGDELPSQRQTLTSRVIDPVIQPSAAVSEAKTIDQATAQNQVADDTDVIDEALLKTNMTAEERGNRKHAEVANIRAQMQIGDSTGAKTTDHSSNLISSLNHVADSKPVNTASQALPPHLQTISVPVSANAQQWGDALGERVSFLINQKMNNAEIRIDPPHLGKLDIQIQVKDDSAVVVIHTQHAHTRDLVDSSSFRLRDILQHAGYSSVDVNVSHRDSSSEQQTSGNQQPATLQPNSTTQDSSVTAAEGVFHRSSVALDLGRIDYFA